MERLARRDLDVQRRLVQEQGLYLPSIEQGRRLHLLGRIETQDEKQGALSAYLNSRVTDETIAEIAKSEAARERFGLPPLPPQMTPQQRQTVLEAEAGQLRLNKQHASYWIGLAQYDLGQYEAAINWLQDRTLEAYPGGVWTAAARYNLGRTYEALDRTDDARKHYFQSESPQRHGDLLRARLLREE
jgi:TolA-binding protein